MQRMAVACYSSLWGKSDYDYFYPFIAFELNVGSKYKSYLTDFLLTRIRCLLKTDNSFLWIHLSKIFQKILSVLADLTLEII